MAVLAGHVPLYILTVSNRDGGGGNTAMLIRWKNSEPI